MPLTKEEMFELVPHPDSDNRNRLKDFVSELRHCNNDPLGPQNCGGGIAIPSFYRCNHCREMPRVKEKRMLYGTNMSISNVRF